MALVVPAIIPRSDADIQWLSEKVARRPLMIHVDYVGRSYGGQLGREFLPSVEAFVTGVRYGVHIMEGDQSCRLVDHFLMCGVDTVIVQYEVNQDVSTLRGMARRVHERGAEFMVSLLIDTPLTVLEPLRTFLDGVQLMSIATIGSQGQPFDERVYDRIGEVKRMTPLPVYVDGGVSMKYAGALVARGADVLVVGSAIVKNEDPARAYEELCQSVRG